MSYGFCWRKGGIARNWKLDPHARSRRTNDDNLVRVFGGRDFSGQYVVKRIYSEGWLVVAPFVELRQHQCRIIRLHAQLANLH